MFVFGFNNAVMIFFLNGSSIIWDTDILGCLQVPQTQHAKLKGVIFWCLMYMFLLRNSFIYPQPPTTLKLSGEVEFWLVTEDK